MRLLPPAKHTGKALVELLQHVRLPRVAEAGHGLAGLPQSAPSQPSQPADPVPPPPARRPARLALAAPRPTPQEPAHILVLGSSGRAHASSAKR